MDLNFTITVTNKLLDEIEEFVSSPEFIKFCLKGNTDISIPGFILTTIFNEIDKCRKELDKEENL